MFWTCFLMNPTKNTLADLWSSGILIDQTYCPPSQRHVSLGCREKCTGNPSILPSIISDIPDSVSSNFFHQPRLGMFEADLLNSFKNRIGSEIICEHYCYHTLSVGWFLVPVSLNKDQARRLCWGRCQCCHQDPAGSLFKWWALRLFFTNLWFITKFQQIIGVSDCFFFNISWVGNDLSWNLEFWPFLLRVLLLNMQCFVQIDRSQPNRPNLVMASQKIFDWCGEMWGDGKPESPAGPLIWATFGQVHFRDFSGTFQQIDRKVCEWIVRRKNHLVGCWLTSEWLEKLDKKHTLGYCGIGWHWSPHPLFRYYALRGAA